jgi:hypothetical protein
VEYGSCKTHAKVVSILFSVVLAAPSEGRAEDSCAALAGLKITGFVEVSSASAKPAAGDEPAYCDVIGKANPKYVDPTAPENTSIIGLHLKLPLGNAWNRRFAMLGGGGFEGDLNDFSRDKGNNNGKSALARGYAVGTTDTGHESKSAFKTLDASWAGSNPPGPGINDEKEINWAYRGTYLAALAEKRIIRAFYGKAPSKSYYLGLSNSGGTALKMARYYPGDFDGIIAGSPLIAYTASFRKFVAIQQAQFPQATQAIPVLNATAADDKFTLISSAVLARCDAADGLADGVVMDQRRCDFDPDRDLPSCVEDVDRPGCLTLAEKNVLKTIYAQGFGPDLQSREWRLVLALAFPYPKSTLFPNLQFALAQGLIQNFITDRSAITLPEYVFQKSDVSLLRPADAPSNLSNYLGRGKKLLLWTGWLDPLVSPRDVIRYYESAARGMSRKKRDANIRLFMVPGYGHGAVKPDPLPSTDGSVPMGSYFYQGMDFLTAALEQWVEQDHPPDEVPIVSMDGKIYRPLCPYPKVAKLKETGRPNPVLNNYGDYYCEGPE